MTARFPFQWLSRWPPAGFSCDRRQLLLLMISVRKLSQRGLLKVSRLERVSRLLINDDSRFIFLHIRKWRSFIIDTISNQLFGRVKPTFPDDPISTQKANVPENCAKEIDWDVSVAIDLCCLQRPVDVLTAITQIWGSSRCFVCVHWS